MVSAGFARHGRQHQTIMYRHISNLQRLFQQHKIPSESFVCNHYNTDPHKKESLPF